jgi:hypothetical protein
MATVDISLLSESAIVYQKDLKLLPYAVLRETLGMHGINLFPGVQNKHVITEFMRKRGIAKPYQVGLTVSDSDLGKAIEMTLEVYKAYASIKDNINKYKTISVGPADLLGSNQTKKHPWQMVMLSSIVKTFGEDILDAIFAGKRDVADQSPTGMFDGYDTLIDNFISAGNIKTANGNLVATGSIDAPSTESDFACFTSLLAFWQAAHPQLRTTNSLMLLPADIWDNYNAAHFNKFRYMPVVDEYQRTILTGTGGKCKIIPSNIMGTGKRIILTIPGNLDFGMNTLGDEEFVQVRDIETDPNEVRFWIQGDYGTRIRSINEKVFQVNDGTPVPNAMSGDYIS